MSPQLPSPLKPKSTSTQGKPVLDERAFQGLLAAVYILQEHHERQIEQGREANRAALPMGNSPPIRSCRCPLPPSWLYLSRPAVGKVIVTNSSQRPTSYR